jgi:hypothetical protein
MKTMKNLLAADATKPHHSAFRCANRRTNKLNPLLGMIAAGLLGGSAVPRNWHPQTNDLEGTRMERQKNAQPSTGGYGS